MRILITGACGVTPRAIARSLRLSPHFRDATLIGTDRGGNWYGFHEGLYERLYRVPGTGDPSYVPVMSRICDEEEVGVAVVSPESEVRFWSTRKFPVPVLLPSARFVDVAISKKKLYDALSGTGLIPDYKVVSRAELLDRRGLDFSDGPVWLRDFSDASSSGLGAMLVHEPEQAYSWAYLNPGIDEYMVAEYLPGRNFACNLLFADDELLKVGCYERLEYFGGHLIISGVSGNISRGQLINDPRLPQLGEQAIRAIAALHSEPSHGLFTVDLREAADGSPRITEINVRHTAATSALAAGGANLAEAQLLATLGRRDEIGEREITFDQNSIILRDIDGPPLVVHDLGPDVGEFTSTEAEQPAK